MIFIDNNFDLSKLDIKEYYVFDIDESISDNKGRVVKEDQCLGFDIDGKEFYIYFTLDVDGYVDIEPGDYLQPEDISNVITNKEVYDVSVLFEGEEIELDNEALSILQTSLLNFI